MKKITVKLAVVTAVTALTLVTGIGLAGCTSSAPAAAPASTSASPLLPVTTNPIVNPSTASGLSVVDAMAENNVEPSTKKPIGDRLQVTLKNTSAQMLSGFEIYYTMTDAKTKKSESYYLPLTGLTIASGASSTVFFDNQPRAGHYAENPFSIYRSSKNQVDFNIEVSAKGVAVAKGTAVKGAGTGEVAGG